MSRTKLQKAMDKAKEPVKTAAEEIIQEQIAAQEEQEQKKEAKTRNTTFLLRPTTFEKAKIAAHKNGTSVNALVDNMLEQYVKDNAEVISKYEEVFGKIEP